MAVNYQNQYNHRKGDIKIKVIAKNQLPISDAKVAIEQIKHYKYL